MTSTTNKSVIGIKFPYQQITLTQISNQAMYCLIQLIYSYGSSLTIRCKMAY